MSVLEAMGAGLPVVATHVGGIPELVRPGVDGYLVPAGDRAALADALASLVSDAERRRWMGNQARERVAAHFASSRVASQVEELYRELGARAGTPMPGRDDSAE
jgi:glycosyltransferase involved in cell wall biosynthesis